MKTSRMGSVKYVLLGMAISLSACADEKRPQDTVPSTELRPYSIGFEKDGTPVVLDAKGNIIEPSDVKFPIKATEIESVESITLVQYRGSHVQLMKIGGRLYAIPLPH
ncbi:hypothetical protein [Ketobacter alkanivorans]|uniref:Uncharacterized protein n=1 Tax=Ketobacter alkanivorans TaxID=1917421 RepID=A0A2K9LHV2_9GAMM|nr:hypothetical protein [Ketobacter alkanivorans]AUM11817.1 hypothetical protein Kalk_05005 [Ketobacter alkanivorans]